MTPDHEQQIYEMHRAAAELEYEAAHVRLDTAKREAESARKTLAMADMVAESMLARERQA